MSKYRIGQRVEVTIERVLPFGVFARLGNGARAYIRRRELDLDADIDPLQIVSPGQKITAEIVKLKEGQKYLELSYRATLGDPWKDFARQHNTGEVVRGMVRAIHSSGIFVRVAAGVQGYIPLAELAVWEIAKPDQVFWTGDDVEAVITHLDARNQHLSLSIRARTLQQTEALEAYEYLAEDISNDLQEITPQAVEKYSKPVISLPGATIGKVLVVEDDPGMRTSLVHWLTQRGLEADDADSHSSAVSRLEQEKYGVVFLDLNLEREDGLELIQHIQNLQQHPHICVISSFYTILEREEDLLAAKAAQVFPKPLDMEEIEEFLVGLGKGEFRKRIEPVSRLATSSLPVFGKSQESMGAPTSTENRLRAALVNVTKMLHAEQGLIFEQDPASQVISILVKSGNVTFNEIAMYQLGESPVEDVIREGISVFENHVTQRAIAKFDKLLNFMRFESCIGVPIPVQDEVRHAAFFFHSDEDAFRRHHLQTATIGAVHFTAILEQESLNCKLQSLNPMLLSGELTAGLGHEVSNKISSMELQVRNLLPVRRRARDEIEMDFLQLLNVVLDLKKTMEIFQQLVLVPDEKTMLSINTIIEKATSLLKPIAHKEHTKVVIRLDPKLPMLEGNSMAIQQAVLNIMLNAIQQIALKSQKNDWHGVRILEVSTSFDQVNEKILLRFGDMGPGIHRKLWERIFAPGFSTRNGSGLGLYIARNFVTALGGTIRVEESFVPLGTTFLMELPVGKHEGEGAQHE